MIAALPKELQRAGDWPAEDQRELADYARVIEAPDRSISAER
jgi:hypothetical protein